MGTIRKAILGGFVVLVLLLEVHVRLVSSSSVTRSIVTRLLGITLVSFVAKAIARGCFKSAPLRKRGGEKESGKERERDREDQLIIHCCQ